MSRSLGYILNSYYSYDNNGNITRYNMTGGSDMEWWSLNTDEPVRMGETYYHYDTANQLVREDNMWLGKTFVWTYDDAGNITSCKEYAYINNWEEVTGTPTKTNTYTYGDSSWGDLLTAYNGVQWSYDQIGNLTNDGTWTYTWQNGRELASMSNGSTTWNYTYDANGMRTSRSNGSTTYNYVYNGDQLVQMTKGSDTLYFTYGAIGPTTVTWNGTTYYYAVNAQGDVMGIFDGSGNCVVTYNWDNAWGYNPEPEGSLADTLGTLNPLRYRSYVYDEETELYYLNTRYYDPEICRFINADIYLTTGQGLTGNNMFAYCGNNPVSRIDNGGEWWNVVIGAVVGAAISAISTAISGGSTEEILVSAACGAVSGAFAATGFGGVVGQMAVGAVTSAIDSGYQNYNDYKSGEKTLGEAIGGTLVDTALGATFGAMGAEGTGALKASNKIAKNTNKAIKTLTKKVLHPSVRSTAKVALKQGGKYILNEFKSSFVDNVLTTVTGNFISDVSGLYISAL